MIRDTQQRVDNFNRRCPVGGRVVVVTDGLDEAVIASTRSFAYLDAAGQAVVFLEGLVGCYHLSCVFPLREPTDSPAGVTP